MLRCWKWRLVMGISWTSTLFDKFWYVLWCKSWSTTLTSKLSQCLICQPFHSWVLTQCTPCAWRSLLVCSLACFLVFIAWLFLICLFACLFLCFFTFWLLYCVSLVFVSLFLVFFVFVWLVACLSFAHFVHSGRWGQASRDRFDSGSVSFSVQGQVLVGMKGMGWYEHVWTINLLFVYSSSRWSSISSM